MDYKDALAYINDKDKFGSRLGLGSIERLLELLGNPHRGLNYIHVAGTNGKGSTSSYLSSIIKEAGYKVGLFTSPYLERFNERIQINGIDIPNEILARITSIIREKANIMVEEGLQHPTTFEIITAISFAYYKEENVDYVVLEVGLGGRYDSTNIINSSIASVITTLDFDHLAQLGNTLGEIAYQKAGIIKKEGLVISYPQQEEALVVLEDVSKEMNAEFNLVNKDNININDETEFGSSFDYEYKEHSLKNVKISMIGQYQIYNAALAITTLLTLREKGLIELKYDDIYNGLLKSKWNGRLEVIKRNPTFLIDGAHNLQGVKYLTEAIKLFKYKKLILGVGILSDKDVEHMIELLAPIADIIIATEVNMPRRMVAEELAEGIRKYNKNVLVEENIKKAVEKSLEIAEKDDLIVFGGSLYLIGEVRTLVNLL